MMFWKKTKLDKETARCRDVQQNLQRNIDYTRDLLSREDLDKMKGLLEELGTALKQPRKQRDAKELRDIRERILKAGRKIFPADPLDSWRENVEVVVVAIIIALALRSFWFQPFKIPTGSMQPTLNGVRYTYTDGNHPNILLRGFDQLAWGRSYYTIQTSSGGRLSVLNEGMWIWFPWTEFSIGGETQRVWLSMDDLGDDALTALRFKKPLTKFQRALIQWRIETRRVQEESWNEYLKQYGNEVVVFAPNEVVATLYSDTGDQLLVNKMVYHFRKPARGEIFVFTTEGIADLQRGRATEYYIKRCVGLPGDQLSLQPLPNRLTAGIPQEGGYGLVLDGELLREPYPFERIYSLKDGYNGYGLEPNMSYLDSSIPYTVPDEYYWAMGDNSLQSLDSRYWGGVPRKNLVGTATIVYWPFTWHWGLIW